MSTIKLTEEDSLVKKYGTFKSVTGNITDCSVSTDFWYVEQENNRKMAEQQRNEKESLKMSQETFTRPFTI